MSGHFRSEIFPFNGTYGNKDISKFFNREQTFDVLGEAYRAGVRGKPYRLLFEMNRKNKIKVKTLIGTTEEEETNPGLGQGTIKGAILSANSLSKGVDDYLDDENDTNYGNIVVKSLLWQDDIAAASKSIESAQAKKDKIIAMLESKLLDANESKSVCMVFGKKKYRNNKLGSAQISLR